MRVTLVGPFPPQKKGEAHYLGEYATALRRRGDVDVAVVSQYWDQPFSDAWNGFDVSRNFFDRSLRPSFAPNGELVEAVLRTKPQAVHLHYGPNQDYGGRLGEPLVAALREFRKRGIKVVLTLHSLWLPRDVLQSRPARRLPAPMRPIVLSYFGRLMRALRASCETFACLVSAPKSPVTQAFGSAYRIRDLLEEVHGCTPRFWNVPTGPPMVFSFGFFRPDKGFEYLIDAFGQYIDRGGTGSLLVVGRPQCPSDETYARSLRAKASQIPGDRCKVEVRFCPDDELESLLRASALVVLPYLRNVGASGPLHHALGAGRPIVTTDVGHNRALSGVVELVPPADAAALGDSLCALLRDETALTIATQRVRSEAVRRSWDCLADRYARIYAGANRGARA